ncbi:peroxide stress protein YaaA [Alginatibacterium sediminis]|uniref:UPF0246 protein DBZ36_14860 n=1 Tax=Alginatibacterium sediminis TaxID=2164068 RepID=A0A420E8I2_9ALTE|nr:peroxide stress protein YaaA [Alginatibacterium sediminis]RKF15663.1 peroxide stress protein YaaA [Alginatibacterium sediminis]
MLALISPAKTLDMSPSDLSTFSLPQFLDQSQSLITIAQQLDSAQISSLMKVSDKIAGLNVARFAQWHPNFDLSNSKQAILAFRGDVYTGLDADSLGNNELEFAQQHVRILSGLYGLLRPLDLMMAYRLEMGIKLSNPKGSNLYQFWQEQLTSAINQELQQSGSDVVINLASNEYFKAIKTKELNAQVVTPVFKDWKNGQYKMISFFAKKARGSMIRYILDRKINDVSQLRAFNSDGYVYSEELSNNKTLTFLRNSQ